MQEIMLEHDVNQISGKQLQIHTANIPILKTPSISSNRAVS